MQYANEDQELLAPSQATPFSMIPIQEKIDAAKQILSAALPNVSSTLGGLLKDVISLYFIGHLNNQLVFAAAGFGLTWTNAFGTAIIFGFAAGFGTLASQAYGAKNYRKLGILYQKILVVMAILLLGICFILFFTRIELVSLGFEENLATQIGYFIRCLLLDLMCCAAFETTRFYLLAQNIFNIPAYVLLISTSIHIIWCHLFINVMGLELLGMALARTITDVTSLSLLLIYIKIKNPCPESWIAWTNEALIDVWKFAKEIASHGSSIYFEWIAFEISTIIIGFLGNVAALAAHSATLNYMFANGTLSLGTNISTGIFVGNAAGEGSLEKAQKYSYVGLTVNALILTIQHLFLILFRSEIASFYTTEPEIHSIIVTMLTFYIFGMHADLGCNMFAFLLRTLGQEQFVLKAFLISYYGAGLVVSLFLGVILGYDYNGVWIGLLGGCYLMLGFTGYRFLNLNWKEEVQKIANIMKKKSSLIEHDVELLNLM